MAEQLRLEVSRSATVSSSSLPAGLSSSIATMVAERAEHSNGEAAAVPTGGEAGEQGEAAAVGSELGGGGFRGPPAAVNGAAGPTGGDTSVLMVVCSQRDRFKKRMGELEEVRQQPHHGSQEVTEALTVAYSHHTYEASPLETEGGGLLRAARILSTP